MNPITRQKRRRLMIGIVLLIALLLPLGALWLAVGDAYPGYVCGRWWYGLIFVSLFVSQKNRWLK